MWVVYFANSQWTDSDPVWPLLIYFVVGNIVLAPLVPALVVHRNGGLARLGFTRKKLWWAAGVSLVLSAGRLPQALNLASDAGVDLWPHLAYKGLILWEPLFVYGWLQLRFREAFGWLPASLVGRAAAPPDQTDRILA